MRLAIAAVVIGWLSLGWCETTDACVIRPEANKLLGWSEDGTVALVARVEEDGKVSFAELHPTRYEGFRYVIAASGSSIRVTRAPVVGGKTCTSENPDEIARYTGQLTEASVRGLPLIQKLKLVAPPADDGGAAKFTVKLTPQRRYAEHQIEVSEGKKRVALLRVPLWCSGSCLRDEVFASWAVELKQVVTTGDRQLYVVRIKGACNGGNDKDLWIERVVAAPGKEPAPQFGRCRGSLP